MELRDWVKQGTLDKLLIVIFGAVGIYNLVKKQDLLFCFDASCWKV